MDTILFSLGFLSTLCLPGYALVKLIKIGAPNLISVIALSYSLFAIAFIIANHFGINAHTLGTFYTCLIALSAIFIILSKSPLTTKLECTPFIIIIGLSGVYQLIFGAFTEIPSDIYAHLERYQGALSAIQNDTLGKPLAWKYLLFQRSGVWYYLLAFCAYISNINAIDLIGIVDFLSRTMFLCASYALACFVFKHQANRIYVAGLTTLFVALHMGINVFAYVRTYSLAPTMLNMVIYFFCISSFISLLNKPFNKNSLLNYLLISLCIIAASSIHTQEALFAGIMVTLIAIALLFSPNSFSTEFRNRNNTNKQALVIFCLALIGFISVYLYSFENLNRAVNAHWRLWEFSEGFGYIPTITILNLKFQFIRVVTLWGVLVYILFFLHFKRYKSNLFILAGMLSPIATFLNPFFVDIFMRHYNSTTVWRLVYLLPIHYVAADLFIYYIKQALQKSSLKKAGNLIIPIAMIALLLPFKNTWNAVHYSRAPTLKSTESTLGYSNYKDLLTFLSSIDSKQRVITDPVTGYMISALTKHQSKRRKFFRGNGYITFSFKTYDNNPLDRYRGHLLVLNQRTKPVSEIGRLSGHWSKYEWYQTHHYYPDALIKHIKDRPTRFNILWGNNDVEVYQIN